MTFPLGRYGDNHVTPDMLFDPNDPTARAPEDAVDVQFRCPSSLNAMLDGMAQGGRQDLIDQWRAVYAEIAEDSAMFLQRGGGRVIDTERSGLAPARLAITAVMHAEVPGFTLARWHLHLYVGATGVSLLDGQRLPVHWDSVDLGMRGLAQRRNINQVWTRTTELWGVRWDQPRPGAEDEIMDPPWHEHIDSLDRGVCPGPEPWGPRRVMVADEEALRLAERMERTTAREIAEGRGPRQVKLLSDDDEDEVLPRAAGAGR